LFGDIICSKRSYEYFKAAAALCVSVGSFSDPKHVPGMAHFLEHMVFMGSEKFPDENDFNSFITVIHPYRHHIYVTIKLLEKGWFLQRFNWS
jgi:predicted Zn-dependent peptidase